MANKKSENKGYTYIPIPLSTRASKPLAIGNWYRVQRPLSRVELACFSHQFGKPRAAGTVVIAVVAL